MVLDRMQSEREARGETEFNITPPVRYYLQDFYRWDGREWKLGPSFELVVVRILQDAVRSTDLTNNFIRSVITNLQGIVLLHPSDVRPPFWIRDEERQQVHECPVLGLDNGIINLSQLQARGCEVQLAPHNPSLFGVPRLNFQFDATAPCPLWVQTLREIRAATSPTDHRIDLLQEYFG